MVARSGDNFIIQPELDQRFLSGLQNFLFKDYDPAHRFGRAGVKTDRNPVLERDR